MEHGGAAGGAAAGLHGLLKAKLVNGIDCFLELTGFDQALARAGLVITGEGSMDEQTLQGKGPLGVAVRARKRKIPVFALAGRVSARAKAQLRKYFDELLPIGRERMDSRRR
jgi:glycerate kinase